LCSCLASDWLVSLSVHAWRAIGASAPLSMEDNNLA
jgi:hypothetical protein